MDREQLRIQAEAKLKDRIGAVGPVSKSLEDMDCSREQLLALLYQMQVSDAELEIQNQELRATQMALEASADRYADLFDFSPLGYVILDGRGVIGQINLVGAAMLGRHRAHVVGFPLIHFLIQEDRWRLLNFLGGFRERTRGPKTAEFQLLVQGADPLPVEFYGSAGMTPTDGHEIRIAMTGIAERKAAEAARQAADAEVRRARDELERRVAERTAELESVNRLLRDEVARGERLAEDLCRINDELAAADRYKDDFMAMLAHELRNPLAAIANAGEILRRQADGQNGLIGHAAQIIKSQTAHFKVLLDDLLDIARVTRGKIVLKPEVVPLSRIVAQAVETHSAFIEDHSHRLCVAVPEEPIYLLADFTRCVQIVGNLLHNAAKFTPPGGEIDLSVQREGGEAVIRVRDNGAGIPPDLIDRIFDPFTQEDRTLARSTGGLGIGLALVRRLVEMQGGKVDASSQGPGQGSQFTVRFPVSEASPEPVEA